MRVNAGDLDQRVTVQTATSEPDETGQPIETWTDTKTVWAKAITGGGREFYIAQKVHAEANVGFEVRHDPSIVVTQRLVWNGRTFEILAIDPVDGQRRKLLIAAREVV